MTGAAIQLPLDLGHRPALGRDDFLVTPSNAEAVAWIDRWPAWPAPGLVLEGRSGAGKTHLAQVWRGRAGAGLIEGGDLTAAMVPALLDQGRNLVVERAETAPDEPLLHLYNAMAESGGCLLLTSAAAASRWPIRLADLASRLRALPVASLHPPDDHLIRALLGKLFADRQLVVGAEIIDFLLNRMERSHDAARHLVAALDQAALSRRRPVTIALAREILTAANPAAE